MFLDDLLTSNRQYVGRREATPLPPLAEVPLAVVACYDPRLDSILRPALGLGEGEGFLFRAPGALVRPASSLLRSLALAIYLFEVRQVLVVGHTSCRMAQFSTAGFVESFRRRGVARDAFGGDDLRRWAGAIPDPKSGVLMSIGAIARSPFLPRDLVLAGGVLDDTSGRLEVVYRPGDPLPSIALGGEDTLEIPPLPPEVSGQPAAKLEPFQPMKRRPR